jgi:hypothetical protein
VISPRHADVEVYGLRALEEPVEVHLQKGELAIVQAEALPHPVPHQETRVEDGDLRLLPVVKLAVYVDEDVLVALVGQGLMRSPGQPSLSPATPRASRP